MVWPEILKSIRPDIQEKLSIPVHDIAAGTEESFELRIPSVNTLYSSLLDSKTLFFNPDKYIIRTKAALNKSDSKLPAQHLHATYELKLKAPLSSVLRGGVLGALLHALLILAYRARNAKHEHNGRWKERAKELAIQSLISFFSSSIISVTAILLLYRLGNANLPITVAANDYLGGVIVGLFSYTVGKALYPQLFGKDHLVDLTKEEKPKEV
jgi:hypothetical protein